MGKIVTCKTERHHDTALTRGKQYEIIEEKEGNVRLLDDRGRVRWYSAAYFDLDGNHVPVLERWKFDYPEDLEAGIICEVTMQFNNGQFRWTWIATPDSLKNLLQKRDMEPGLWSPHMIVIRSYSPLDVGKVLSDLDRDGELIEASRLIEFEEGSRSDYDGFEYEWHLPIPKSESQFYDVIRSGTTVIEDEE